MELKDKIESVLKNHKNEISVGDLVKLLKIDSSQILEVLSLLYEFEKEGKIYSRDGKHYIHKPDEFYLNLGTIQKSNKNKYYVHIDDKIINIPEKNLNGAELGDVVFFQSEKSKKHSKQLIGNVVRIVKPPKIEHINTFYKSVIRYNDAKKIYYVVINDKEIYIPNKYLYGAYINDSVNVQVIDDKYAKVVNILKRGNLVHVLQYVKTKNGFAFTQINNPNFVIDVSYDEIKDIELNENDKILVNLNTDNKATFIRKLETENTFYDNLKVMLYDVGFQVDFSLDAIKEATNLKKYVDEEDIKERKDYRNLLTFTIDGEDAKDLDDAISLEIEDNFYVLYVHIANVANYIKPGSKLFKEALLKTTSVYPAIFVFPMLPEIISNGICSLNPNEDKLALTTKIRIDKDGNVIDYSIDKSVINSNYKMSYEKVNDILQKNIVDPKYAPYVEKLKQMNELAILLDKKKMQRGTMVFYDTVSKFSLGCNDTVEDMKETTRGPAQLLIENYMILANQINVEFAKYMGIPFMFRNHDGPTYDQISKLRHNLLIPTKYRSAIRNAEDIRNMHKILLSFNKNKSNLELKYISDQILKSMSRAYLSDECIGHYALALDEYATITSPIRRFQDLFNTFIISEVISGNIDKLDKYYDEVKDYCKICNDMQFIVDNFERHVNYLLINAYVTNFVDKVLSAQILFITPYFICVKTNNGIYGNIPIKRSNIKNSSVVVDGHIYNVGDYLAVKIDSVDEAKNEILFKIETKKEKQLKKRKDLKI